jgi:hypothetical protein
LRPQVSRFGCAQSKHEILREPAAIALHLLIHALCRHLIQFRQVSIQHDLLTADHVDTPVHQLNRKLGNGYLSRSGHTTIVVCRPQLSHWLPPGDPQSVLQRRPGLEQRVFLPRGRDQLQPDRQTLG